ncbi:MAG: hypothetical protein JEZ08_08600 [Clostridiales bacterium]|nr:hypothetical protein [Clostridiales bacterium]
MNYILSKLARTIIIINIILSLSMAFYSGAKIIKIEQTADIIGSFMEENNVDRDDAIFLLEQQGVELYLGDEFFALYGMVISISSIILLIVFAKNNSLPIGLLTAMTCVFTSFIGGFLLFYVILSNKLQVKGEEKEYTYKDDWSHFIHEKTTSDQ